MSSVSLDKQMNEDIKELTDSIMNENLGESAKDFLEFRKSYKETAQDSSLTILKADEDKRLVFGWALVSALKDGTTIVDHQGDIVDQDELEEGAYEYVLNFRDSGEEHMPDLRKKARLVESVVFTEEKLQAMGIPFGTVPIGWWIGFYVDDDEAWEKIKDGTYRMFSIEGKAVREPVHGPVTKSEKGKMVKELERTAKSFSELMKFNPYHDRLGRFATGGGYGISSSFYTGDRDKQAVTFSANPKTVAGARAIERHGGVIPAAYGGPSVPAPGNKQPKVEKPKQPKPKTEKPKEKEPKETPESNFKPAKNKKEAVEYAKKELGFDRVSYGTKLDIDTINHINKQVADIQAKYPETKGAVQELKTISAKNTYAQISTDSFGNMSFQVSSKLYGSGLDTLEKHYEADLKVGFHPKGTTAKDIVWHEYGHVIGGIHAKKAVGVAANETIPRSANTDKVVKFMNSKRAGTWERSVADTASKTLGKSVRDISNGISRYACKNVKELFAEAFAEFNGSANPSPECIALMKAAGIFK